LGTINPSRPHTAQGQGNSREEATSLCQKADYLVHRRRPTVSETGARGGDKDQEDQGIGPHFPEKSQSTPFAAQFAPMQADGDMGHHRHRGSQTTIAGHVIVNPSRETIHLADSLVIAHEVKGDHIHPGTNGGHILVLNEPHMPYQAAPNAQ